MQSTMQLLDEALQIEPAPYWHRELKLSRNALHTARIRQHLSPAVAGALAEKLGKNVEGWVYIAAMESEKDSACRERMIKRAESVSNL